MRIFDENRQEITEYDLTRGRLCPATIIRPEAEPVDGVNKFVYADDDYEDVMICRLNEDREAEETPSAEDTLLELTADHEYRLCMLELGGEL